MAADDQHAANRAVWADHRWDFAVDGWLDPAEPAALVAAAGSVRGTPALDLGVGAGRTVPLLRLLTDDYLGLDYVPEMVGLCRQRHPGADVRLGDARDLSMLGDGSIGFVYFADNGIDAVGHDDRERVLGEVARVLRPGGAFLLSTLNRDGPLWTCRPGSVPTPAWTAGLIQGYVDGAGADHGGRVSPGATADTSTATGDARLARTVMNWRRLSRLRTDAGEWGVGPIPAYDFGLLAHFSTLGAARRSLRAHGLRTTLAWDCASPHPLPAEVTTTRALYFYLLAVREGGVQGGSP